MASANGVDRATRQAGKHLLWMIFGGGALVGVLLFVGFHFLFMNGTDSMSLCVSCHEMEGVYQEYRQTVHYKNTSGVRVICGDCHVPHGKTLGGYVAKLADKVIVGGRHFYHHVTGTYSEPGSFEAARYRLAVYVQDKMRQEDSATCRRCHDFEAMQFADQDKFAASKHQQAMQEGGKTCIDCHAGIAHEEPEEPEEEEE